MAKSSLPQHSFVDMAASLAPAQLGDLVRITIDKRVQPSAFRVVSINGATMRVKGGRGSERNLTYAKADGVVWLCKGGRGRRVVQAWLEETSRPKADPPPVYDEATAVLESLAEKLGHPGEGRQPGNVRRLVLDELDRLRAENEHLRAGSRDMHELNKVHAKLGRDLMAIEQDRDQCRVALGQIRNIAHGTEPGTSMLPSNSPPANVVIDVTAALFRATSSESRRLIRVSPEHTFRDGLAWALPGRMQAEPTSSPRRPEPQSVQQVDGALA